jgi:hypothetical protein
MAFLSHHATTSSLSSWPQKAKSRLVVTCRTLWTEHPPSTLLDNQHYAPPPSPPLPFSGSASEIVTVCPLSSNGYRLRTVRCCDGRFGGRSFDLWSGRRSTLRTTRKKRSSTWKGTFHIRCVEVIALFVRLAAIIRPFISRWQISTIV